MKILKWVFAIAIVGLGLVTVYKSWSAIKLFFTKKNVKSPTAKATSVSKDSFTQIFNRITENNKNISAETSDLKDTSVVVAEPKIIVDALPTSNFLEPVFIPTSPEVNNPVEVFTPANKITNSSEAVKVAFSGKQKYNLDVQ